MTTGQGLIDRYYRTDEESEAADALETTLAFARIVADDFRQWRWISIALHNAAQGFMVLSLRHGNGLLALTPECTQAWLVAHRTNGKYPEEKLDGYLGLYKKVKHSSTGAVGGNTPFKPRGSVGWSIRRLNRIRNDFIHFTPKGMSFEVSGMPRICLDVLSMISFLGWESGNVRWYDADVSERANSYAAELKKLLAALDDEYSRT